MPTDNKSPNQQGGKPPARRAAVAPTLKKQMLAVLVRNKAAFLSVGDVLKVRHVRAGMTDAAAVIYKVASNYFRTHDVLPDKGLLLSSVLAEAEENPSILDDDDIAEVKSFIKYAWDDAAHGKNIAKSGKFGAEAIKTCAALMEEVVAADIRKNMLKDGTLPLDLPAMLEQGRADLDLIGSMTGIDLDLPFPENWDKRSEVKLATTGVPALDELMGGGWRGGEVVLFMGPFGSCKTVTTVHATAQLIRRAAVEYAEGNTRRNKDDKPMIPVVVLIFTESNADQYRVRLMSHMARIPWKRILAMESMDDLSSATEPGAEEETKYENIEFAEDIESGSKFFSEQERMRRAVLIANKHLRLLDCTDSEDSKHQVGRGGIVEIANIVRSEFRRRKDVAYPAAFWLDHISALVDRMAEAAIGDEQKLHLLLKRIPRQAADKLAKAFNAPVGLLHQLSGEANRKSATAKFHHAESAGSKSVAEYADFAVVTGPVDDNGLCKWEATKHRREPPKAAKIIHVQGDYNRLIDKSTTHAYDAGKHMFVLTEELTAHAQAAKAQASLKSAAKPKPKKGSSVGMELFC